MASYYRAPDPLQSTFFIPGSNTPGSGVQLFIYVAGSSTKTTVYKDNAGSAQWTNPIVLDSGGNLPSSGTIWIPAGVTIKAVYAPSNDTDPPVAAYDTFDNIAGINDVTATASEWVTGPTPTFINVSTMSFNGDQTSIFTTSRRIQAVESAGTVYGKVANSVVASGSTTVYVAMDSTALDSGLTSVSYGLLDPANPSIFLDEVTRATNISSAATTNIWGDSAGSFQRVSGTTQINSFSTKPYGGAVRMLSFAGSLVVSTSAADMQGASNISTAAEDFSLLVEQQAAPLGKKGLYLFHFPASGYPKYSKVAVPFSTINQTVSSASVQFMSPAMIFSTGTEFVWDVPFDSIAKNMYMRSGASPTTSGSFIYTMRQNGSSTALTTKIASSAASSSAQDLSHTVTLAAGDRISVSISTNAAAALTSHWGSIELDPIGY